MKNLSHSSPLVQQLPSAQHVHSPSHSTVMTTIKRSKKNRYNDSSPLLLLLILLVLSFDKITVLDAFMTTSSSSMIQQQRSQKHQKLQQKSPTSRQMAATKSGGKAILSIEQFETDVLLLNNEEGEEGDDGSPSQTKPILVLYSAPWCGPCRLTNPIVKQISSQYANLINAVEVCTDDLPTIAESAGVVSIPTLQLYYNGRCYDTIVGCVTINVLSSAIDKVLDDLGLLVKDDDDGASKSEIEGVDE